MATKNNAKQPNKLKPLLMVVAFLVSLYLLFTGIMLASDWNKIRPYKALAADVNKTLGGGYKIGYTWRCGLETSNCPSARMLKDASFKDNDEAKATITQYKKSLESNGYTNISLGICEADKYFAVYCSIEAKKDGKTITINAKQDFIGIDIQS